MRRSFVISDMFYRLTHVIKRNRVALVIYALCCLVFIIVGVTVGIKIGDKTEYILINRAPIFSFLRGDSGSVKFFFIDLLTVCVYCLFAASMFFHKAAAFLSLAPCMYMSYCIGVQTTVILTVFTVPAVPMLFVFFVPISVVQITVICMLSFKSFKFAALNGRCSPSKSDICEHYRTTVPFFIASAICTLVKTVTVAMFGAGLIGVI